MSLWMTAAFFFLQFTTSKSYVAERYEVIVYHKEDTSLSCLDCFNGDNTGDCMTLSNISNIPTKKCQHYQRYCKVRRLDIDGKLETFDRYCAEHCVPGVLEAARYTEYVSCCNTSNCNTDNLAPPTPHPHLCLLAVCFFLMTHVLYMKYL